MKKEVIGNATLYCGDILEILQKIPTGSINACITDPPYGINTKSDVTGKLNPWADLCNAAFWYSEWIKQVKLKITQDGCRWSFLNWRSIVTFQKAAIDSRWPIESLLVWNKDWIGPGGHKGLRPSYEFVALFAGQDFSIKNRSLPDIQTFKWSAHKPTGHPAEKPTDLIKFLVNNSTKKNQLVLDPFLGSGTTGVCCVNLNRKFIGIEIEEFWFDYSCRRIEQAQKQIKLFDEVAP